MKFMVLLLTGAVLLAAGCVYEAPLSEAHDIAVDSAMLGVWEGIPDGDDPPGEKERMIILKFSDTEYLVHYPAGGNDEMYYRGYSIKIGGVACVQLEVMGTEDGPLPKDTKRRFSVASYRVVNGELEVKLLNTDLVDGDLKTGKQLNEAFLKHAENAELFTNPSRFKRIKK